MVPTYLQSVGIAQAMGAAVRIIGLDEKEGWKVPLSKLEGAISSKTKAIMITNPNNPTGSMLDQATLEAICGLADRVGAYVIGDEALRGLEIEGSMSPSPTELYERGFSTGSLSKMGLGGIRIGWIVGPRATVEQCRAHKDYTTLAHNGLGEGLAELALEPRNIDRFRSRSGSSCRRLPNSMSRRRENAS